MLLLEYRVFLVDGFIRTLLMSAVVMLAGTLVAIFFAFELTRRSWVARRATLLLVELVRDIPLMVTVLLAYFVLPNVGVALDPFWSSSLSISVWGGANGAHIIRAGLLSVPKAQREAATALGLRSWKRAVLVVLPQAMPVILPPYVSLLTEFVQATSLGAVIGVHELFRSGQVLIEQTTIARGGSPAFLVYGFILVVYFVLCWLISCAGRAAERRFARAYAAAPAQSRRKQGATAVLVNAPNA
jgi:polar amino acid transport system permease protein